MRLFRYLASEHDARSWLDGGVIPLFLAKRYFSEERNGIMTPDERRVINTNRPYEGSDISRVIAISDSKGISITGARINGVLVPDFYGDHYLEDGRVLCLSVHLSGSLAKRMEKTVCVEIVDIASLKACLDQQVGVKSKMGLCKYVKNHNRNHFMKSAKDSWQAEYRLFWPTVPADDRERIDVILPQRVACRVELPEGFGDGPDIPIAEGKIPPGPPLPRCMDEDRRIDSSFRRDNVGDYVAALLRDPFFMRRA